jgi:hypothetical protein
MKRAVDTRATFRGHCWEWHILTGVVCSNTGCACSNRADRNRRQSYTPGSLLTPCQPANPITCCLLCRCCCWLPNSMGVLRCATTVQQCACVASDRQSSSSLPECKQYSNHHSTAIAQHYKCPQTGANVQFCPCPYDVCGATSLTPCQVLPESTGSG